MKIFGLQVLFSIALSTCVWNTIASTTIAQRCACGGSSAGVMVEPMGGAIGTVGLESLLEQADNPAETINFTVVVPDKAIVSFNGEPTFTTGSVRNYVVRGLKPGKTYKFEVTGFLKNEFGAEYFAKQEVKIAAGGTEQVVLQLRRQKRAPPPPAPFVLPAPPAAPAK